MAGVSGTRSRRRTFEKAFSRPPGFAAREASIRTCAIFLLCRIGASERLSAPPAIPASACRQDGGSHLAIASLAEAQARHGVGRALLGEPVDSTTSGRGSGLHRGMTWPITTYPMPLGSTSVRSTSSRTQALARSSAVRSRRRCPIWRTAYGSRRRSRLFGWSLDSGSVERRPAEEKGISSLRAGAPPQPPILAQPSSRHQPCSLYSPAHPPAPLLGASRG